VGEWVRGGVGGVVGRGGRGRERDICQEV